MQYQAETEKVATMTTPYMLVPQMVSLKDEPQIQRTRKILIIILGVCLGLSVAALFAGIFEPSVQIDGQTAQRGSQIGQALISILFYGFGVFAAYRYSPLALRVFAWLCIIATVLMGIGIVFFVFMAIIALASASHALSTHSTGLKAGVSLVILFTVGILIASMILSVIIIKFAFKLARLIDAHKNMMINQQI